MEEHYLDLYFATNFLMDYILLRLVRGYRHLRSPSRRCIPAALFGAFLAGVFVCFPILNFLKLPGVVIVSAIMCRIAYGNLKAGKWKAYGSFLGMAFLLGGILYALSSAYDRGNEEELYRGALFLTVVTAAFAGAVYVYRFRKKEQAKCLVYPVELILNGEKFCCNGLMDTGNCLYEPFHGAPVILLQDEECIRTLKLQLEKRPESLRLVPYSSVGKKEGLLEGALLEQVTIRTEEREEEFHESIVAAACEFTAAKKAYQVILHPDMLSDFFGS